MIIVIDTSIWLSALQFGKKQTVPIRAVEKALRSDTLATSSPMNAEIRRVLQEKFHWSPNDAERLVAAYFERAIHVDLAGTIHFCRDPNDDMILECAVVSGAQCIVTGDKDLLVLGSFQGIQLVTPAQYLAGTVSPTRPPSP